MKNRKVAKQQIKRRQRCVSMIEALETRRMLAIFLNDIDSDNLGKGMWAWTLSASMSNDGYSSQTQWFSYLRNTMGLDYLITKAGNGDSVNSQYTQTMVNNARNAGLKIVPYFYIYGDFSDTNPSSHHSTQEAAVFNQVFGPGGPGGDFAIFDIESEYGDNDSAGLINYFNLIGKSASGNGSGSRDKLFMAYSTFDILHFHNTQFPVKTIADYCDAAMPQMYWKAHGYSQAFDLQQVDTDYKSTTLLGANGIKPVIPTGQTYDSGNGLPTAAETRVWFDLIVADTNAVGGTGAPAGWRYKSVNYFDEHTTTAALRAEIGTQNIGDLPGTPTNPTPSNGSSVVGSPATLNWNDVLNTFGAGSVGAATKYQVFIDGVLKTTIDVATSAQADKSSYTVSPALSAGTHTWQIVAKNMFGTTSGPVWQFAVGEVAPLAPTNPTPANNANVTASPAILNWDDATYATSYDVFVDGVNKGNFATSQYTLSPALSQGVHTWQVISKNSVGTAAGAVWTFDIVPSITSVNSTTPNGTYATGANLSIQVNFNGNVTVTGFPQLALNSGGTATYVSGSGTGTLNFSYTVGSGQSTSDLDYSSASALTLNSGTMNDAAGNAVSLTLPTPGASGSLAANKAIVIDALGPTVSSVNSPTANGSYSSGQTISIVLNFNEAAFVAGVGTPTLSLNSGGGAVATYLSGSGTTALTFSYTVAAGQNSSDLDYASTSALVLNGATLRDAGGNNAPLTLPTPGAAGSLAANKALVVDTGVPGIANVTSTAADATYGAGAIIPITLTFSEPVTVAGGVPTLALNAGAGASASYASGSGTATLTFNYTVGAGQSSSDLDYSSSGALALNGATIKDSANNNALLTLAAPGTAGSLGANKAINIDTLAGGVTNVTSSTANGIYRASNVISIQITFNESVAVTGTPRLTLNSGVGAFANYVSGSGGSTLTFNYTVSSGQNTTDLEYASTSALSLNGGTIKDLLNNPTNLTLPTPGLTGSLGFNKNIVIDTTSPQVINITSTLADGPYKAGQLIPVSVQFNDIVTVNTASGTPTLALSAGGGSTATYVSGTGSDTLIFNYTVAAGQNSADLNYTGPTAMLLNGGTIRDQATNNAVLLLPSNTGPNSLASNKDIVVDTTAPTAVISLAAGQADPTNLTLINFTVTFSEPVFGFDAADVIPSGTAGATSVLVTPTGATTYNIAISEMTDPGTVVINIGANAATDAAGNNSTAATVADNTVLFDTTAPMVTNVTSSTANGSYGVGAQVLLSVTLDEAVTTVEGTPQLHLNSGGIANYTGMSGGGMVLNFLYTVAAGDDAADLDYASISALSANDGSMADAAGNYVNSALATPGTAGSLGANKSIVIDALSPSVTINQAAGQSDATNAGPIHFTVVWSEAVSGFTDSDIQLSGTAGATTAVVTPAGGNTYDVAVSGMTSDGTVIASILAGAAQDGMGNVSTVSTSTDNAVTLDTVGPTAGNVTSTTADGSYGVGSQVTVTVAFNEAVNVTGTPQLALNSGGIANYASGSGTGVLSFVYTVAAGHTSADLDYTATSSLSLNGGTIKDAAGNDAGLTLAAPGDAGSLGASKAIVIETVSPTVTIEQAAGQLDPASSGPIHFTVVWSEAVSSFADNDIQLSGTAGATTAVVTPAGGNTYDVAVSGMSANGTVIATILAGAAQDGAGNASSASTSTDNSVSYTGIVTPTFAYMVGSVLHVDFDGTGGISLGVSGADTTATLGATTLSFTTASITGILATGTNNASDVLTVGASATSDSTSLTINNAKAVLSAAQHVLGLNLQGTSLATFASPTGVLVTRGLSIASGSRIDIDKGAIIWDYEASGSNPIADARSLILAGRGGTDFGAATWNAAGGISSLSASPDGGGDGVSFAIGYVDNAFLPQLGLPSYSVCFGQNVDDTTVLIRYTLGADANLDGKVNTDDVTVVGALFGNGGTGDWFLGDFDYDGIVDSDDVTVLGAMYDPTAPALAPAQQDQPAEQSPFNLFSLVTAGDGDVVA